MKNMVQRKSGALVFVEVSVARNEMIPNRFLIDHSPERTVKGGLERSRNYGNDVSWSAGACIGSLSRCARFRSADTGRDMASDHVYP